MTTVSPGQPVRSRQVDEQHGRVPAASGIELTISGSHNTVTVVGGHGAEPPCVSWWTRWRKRGVIIGLFTVLGGTATILTWLGWMP